MINDLLNDAYETYWYWVRDYEVYTILNNAVFVNETRLKLVKLGYTQGDRPAIDTTEALAQLQSFQLARNEAFLNFRNSGLMLSNFLWTAGDSAVYLPETVVPDSSWRTLNINGTQLPVLDSLVSIARAEHPKLASYNFKLQMLDIEKSLKFQNLLPMLNVRYNILNKGYNVLEDASAALYRNNYKFGVDFGLPLRLSQGRGEYRAAKIKIEETNLDVVQARLAIDNKVKYYFNELATLQLQVRIAEDNLQNYQRLFRGEDTRFRVGESSLFILNTRENKVLESMQKLAELKTKFFKSYRSVTWASGQLR
jgi:outer membrane protein TolC